MMRGELIQIVQGMLRHPYQMLCLGFLKIWSFYAYL